MSSYEKITDGKWVWHAIAFFVCFAFVALIQGAIPYTAITTLGQSTVVVGYPISFVNDGIFTFYSHSFGFPEPSPMSTMLAPSMLMELAISLGFRPVDAFNFSFLFYLLFGFWGAFGITRLYGAGFNIALPIASLFFVLPITWVSSGYSHLHFGFVAFPGFFYSLLLLLENLRLKRSVYWQPVFYFLSVVVCVFTDGYTFVFLSVITSFFVIFYCVNFFGALSRRSFSICVLHIAAFSISYLFYTSYIGKSEYSPAGLDSFRGWGADLMYLLFPSEGVHWLWDFLGLSVSRSGEDHFGDASVWTSTFISPLLIVGSFCFYKLRGDRRFATLLVIVAITALYMALGPSLKINSIKPEKMGAAMSSEHAVMPTGTGFLSANVPGFKSMRASYRWIFLTYFSLWMLVTFYLIKNCPNSNGRAFFVLSFLALVFMPDVSANLDEKVDYYRGFLGIDNDLLEPLSNDVRESELVAFLPPGNDFLVNYLAPALGIRTYNVGGDKNVAAAREHWPDTMMHFPLGSIGEDFTERLMLLLLEGDADVVVLPYIDMLWAAHYWPPKALKEERFSQIIEELEGFEFVNVIEREYYAVIRLTPEYQSAVARSKVIDLLMRRSCFAPYCLEIENFNTSTPTRTGVLEQGRLRSTGEAGFIHFGPYSKLRKGHYRLQVYGEVIRASASWIDVASVLGSKIHAKYPLVESDGPVILDDLLVIDQNVDDLEVRVFAGPNDLIFLEGFRLSPVLPAGR